MGSPSAVRVLVVWVERMRMPGAGSGGVARVGCAAALGDGDVAGGPVGQGHLADDDADAVDRRVDGLRGGVGQGGDEAADLLRRRPSAMVTSMSGTAAQPFPPLRKTDPRLVKCSAVLDPGGANTASVMPPVRTTQPASMA